MKIKDEVLAKGSFQIKDGSKTRFWDDVWEGQVSFKDKYQSLYKVVRNPHATVASVMATRPLNLYFRRTLVDIKLVEWQNLVLHVRPGAVGLLIGIECSGVRDNLWMYLTSLVNYPNRRRN